MPRPRNLLINGVGINDADCNWQNGEKKTHYNPWYELMKNETYDVCPEWCRFSNFYKWYSPRWKPGYVLCCELAAPLGTRLHSPENTRLIPKEIKRVVRPQGTGITKDRQKRGWIVRECRNGLRDHIGSFPTMKEAQVVAGLLWAKRLREAADLTDDPEIKELLFKRAWEVYPK